MRGSVMKRGSTWTYVPYLGRDASGKKQQKWVGGHRTKMEAEDALVEALERMRTGMWVDPGTTTLGKYLTEWLAAMESNVLDMRWSWSNSRCARRTASPTAFRIVGDRSWSVAHVEAPCRGTSVAVGL